MLKRVMLPLLLLTVGIGPASAQDRDRGALRSETESRLLDPGTNDVLWNSLGLLGLLGLLGIRRRHSEDSYHPAPLE